MLFQGPTRVVWLMLIHRPPRRAASHFPQIVARRPSEQLITKDKVPGYLEQPSAAKPLPQRARFQDDRPSSTTADDIKRVACTNLFSPPGPGGTACKRPLNSSLPSLLLSQVGGRAKVRERETEGERRRKSERKKVRPESWRQQGGK